MNENKNKPVNCAWNDGDTTLCKGMRKYLQPSHATNGMITFTRIDMTTGVMGNLGIVYKINKKDPGLIVNFCPWCGSNLIENWMNPAKKDFNNRISKQSDKFIELSPAKQAQDSLKEWKKQVDKY